MRSLVATMLLGGCSIIATRGPQPPPEPPACTSSYTPPVVDVVGAVLFGVAAGATGFDASKNQEGSNGVDRGIETGAFAVSLPLAVLFAVSSIIGFHRVSGCNAALQR
jgi:hypothetical protein